MLTFCVNSLYANTINVRSGPGTNYAVIGEPLPLRRCLEFRGVNENVTWLLIAPNQEDPRNTQYEGGWIFRELLGLGLSGPIDLPAVTLTHINPFIYPNPIEYAHHHAVCDDHANQYTYGYAIADRYRHSRAKQYPNPV